jgi:polygalacturonase
MLKQFFPGILVLSSLFANANDVNVTAFGAKGDSTTLNSDFIQKAINECNRTGGGKVIFPAGKYLSGTILLKNNVLLSLQKDAVILGSTNVEDYSNPDPFRDGLGVDVGWALIAAVDVKNVGIEGPGAIDGQGAKLKAQQILTDTRPEGQRWGRRPFLLRVVRCEGVIIKGVSLLYAAAWTSHYFHCRNVRIEKVRILSKGVAHNDGIDIDGSQDVKIKDCDIESGDDALCFKTTSSKMPCSNIEVKGMRLKSNQGAIKMGTESMAAFENIKISDCYIYNTNNGGIKLLTVDGAHLRNIEISDITMVEVKTPILLRLGSRLSVFRKDSDVQQETGSFSNVTIKNVKAKATDSAQLKPASGILITGVPGHYITGVKLENIDVKLAGGGSVADSRVIVPEAIDKYPEVKTFGPTIPAFGLWARHVKNLDLKNICFHIKANDVRPAIVIEDGQNISVTKCQLPAGNGAECVIRLENVDGAEIKNNAIQGKAYLLVKLEKQSINVKVKTDL